METVLVLFGSQSGNSEEIARMVHEEAANRGIRTTLHSMADFAKFDMHKHRVLVCVASSHGDGEPPDSAMKYWHRLQQASVPRFGADVHFAVLGLGDTNYATFGRFPRQLDERLAALGAHRFLPLAIADDGTGLEEVVEPWLAGLWKPLRAVLDALPPRSSVPATSAGATASDAGGVSARPAAGASPSQPVAQNAAAPLPGVTTPSLTEPQPAPCAPSIESAVTASASATSASSASSASPTAPSGSAAREGRAGAVSGGTESSSKKGSTGLPRLPPATVRLEYSVEPSVSADTDDATAAALHGLHLDPPADYDAQRPFMARVAAARWLTRPDAVKRCLHVELDVSGAPGLHQYEPGDAFGVLAPNPPHVVDALLVRLGLDGAAAVRLGTVDGSPLPAHLLRTWPAGPGSAGLGVATVRSLLAHSVDLYGPPKKSLLRLLAESCSDPDERAALLRLCSAAGAADFRQTFSPAGPHLLDLLNTYTSCRPALDRLLDALPPLPARFYSAASSVLAVDGAVHVAFNVVEYPSPWGIRRGLCTGWLETVCQPWLTDGAAPSAVHVPVYRRPSSTFRLPPDPSVPIVMIGAGTGVSPFRGFLQHRLHLLRNAEPGRVTLGESWLFFGCRHEARDFIYRQDLEAFVEQGVLHHLVTAFSRDEPGRKVYVQHRIEEHKQSVIDLVKSRNAHIFVCGDSVGMANDVRATLTRLLSEAAASPEQGRNLMAQLVAEHRLLFDVWS